MPALPMKTLRRKRVLPHAIFAGEPPGGPWVEDDYMLNHSFETRTFSSTAEGSNTNTTDMVPPLEVVNGDPPLPAKKTWFDLPEELQAQVISNCFVGDLVALSLVSKRFRELAAQELYKQFQIIFPDDDDVRFDGSIDALAAGLETFVTSDFNYARFLRRVSLDTVTAGSKGERAYRRYTLDESCGKFMNTLMLLVLRQAKKLETFKWNIRVELRRPLFKELHKIETLQHLHLRLHQGRSGYQKPPPLPSLADDQGEETVVVRGKNNGVTVGDMLFYGALRNDKKSAKSKTPPKEAPDPPTISGFKNLKSLEVLDMDTLDYISEIKEAIEKSASLTKLKLSFSEHLSRQARKPPTPVDNTDDSEGEMDEFGNGLAPPPPPPPMASSDDGNGPQKTLQAQEQKKLQEAVLGKLFDIEASHGKKDKETTSGATTVVDEEEQEEAKFEKEGEKYIRNILMISKKLMTSMSPNRTQQQKEALEIIEKASKKYVEEKKAEKDKKKDEKEKSADGSDAKKFDDDKAEEKEEEKSSGLFDEKDEDKKDKIEAADDAANPDDIDVEAPEMIVDEKDVEEAMGEDDTPDLTWAELDAKIATFSEDDNMTFEEQTLFRKLLTISERPDETQDASAKVDADTKAASEELQSIYDARKTAESEEQLKEILSSSADPTDSKKAMGEYIRSTYGLQLTSLALYLIPIKASVLSKAVDLRCLTRITLLNVGPQAAFWTHMAKENENGAKKLPLQKIQTDNVSMPFLKFVDNMEKCTELFLLERNNGTSEVTADKTDVKIGHIRKALRNQWPHLKRLVIKNESGTWDWDANERFLETLCRRGTNLEELGIAFSSKGVHHLLQSFHGLVNLRALHIIGFRNDDICHWVLQEVRKFIVDIVAHHREMKLEYIAQDKSVERIVWEKKQPKKAREAPKKVDVKGKGKAVETPGSTAVSTPGVDGQPPIFPSLATMVAGAKEEESSSEEESEDDGASVSGAGSVKGSKKGLRCRSLEYGKFYDVFGVRMWKKEVLAARI